MAAAEALSRGALGRLESAIVRFNARARSADDVALAVAIEGVAGGDKFRRASDWMRPPNRAHGDRIERPTSSEDVTAKTTSTSEESRRIEARRRYP